MNDAQTQSLEISAGQIHLPEQLSTVYTFSVGDYNFWFAGWFALVVAVLAVLLLIVIVLIIRAMAHKHDASATKVERRKAMKKKQEEEKRKETASKRDVVAETLAAAPPVTAFTPAEYPDGIDPLVWLAEDGISDLEREKRVETYHVWCSEQKELQEKQVNARRQYFAQNDFGYKVKVDTSVENGEKHTDELTPAEKKEYERIRRDNEKRLARAKKLKAKEEAEAKRTARKSDLHRFTRV